MPQLILQPFRRFTYVTAHSTTFPLLHLSHRHFTYITSHSPTLLLLHLRHSSFSNPSAALPTSQVILQPFCCFTYLTGTSHTSPIHNALYFVKYPSWAAQNSLEGHTLNEKGFPILLWHVFLLRHLSGFIWSHSALLPLPLTIQEHTCYLTCTAELDSF